MRTSRLHSLTTAAALSFLCVSTLAQEIAQIPRKLPPVGIALSHSKAALLNTEVVELDSRMGENQDPDIAIFTKAVRFAQIHHEFYRSDHTDIPQVLLAEARRRLDRPAWDGRESGLIVRGYRSSIDGSVQPYGLEIPEGLDLTKPTPLWVWLHGRGDKETDMYFIHNRMHKHGQFRPENAIVLHPFGRQCVGWKWAGEIDVFEAIKDVSKNYAIDQDRVALMGFSMGGAGAWHIGAHYPGRFAAVHAGAGFAETKEYNRLKPTDYPPIYEQTLWNLYDVPRYARNFFTIPLIAYSGEIDKQIQAARVMESALKEHGHDLRHVIGPKMGHRYDDDSKKKVSSFVSAAVAEGLPPWQRSINLQTRTLRYPRYHWVEITGLVKHWQDSRVDAVYTGWYFIEIKTKNVTSLRIHAPRWRVERPGGPESPLEGKEVPFTIDGTQLAGRIPFDLVRANGEWKLGKPEPGLRKSPGLQGPIDDAFVEPFLFVTPTAKSSDPGVQRWVDFESAHQVERWRALFRGDVRTKPADEITDDDVERYNLILWGDRGMNPHVGPAIDAIPGVEWDAEKITIGNTVYPATGTVLAMIYPNPKNPERYVVFNSGPTFREAHDRTNSLQNPKLPDWSVIGLETPPSDTAPGDVIDAGFFDERWRPQ